MQSCSTAMLGHDIDVDHLLPEAKATSIYIRQHDFPLVPEEIKNNFKKFQFCNYLYPLLEFYFLDLDLWKCHMAFIDMPYLVSIPFNTFSLSFVKLLPGAQHRKI